nr:MAG TPA: hypothetical protein [Caudoviricetes sp.]
MSLGRKSYICLIANVRQCFANSLNVGSMLPE